jgi:thiol:disulfide interchange protein DsbD
MPVMLAAALLLAQADTSPHSQATMTASVRQASPAAPFEVAVRIDLDPEWHTYWQNPGDSGSPTSIKVTAPKGWKVSPPRFEAPHRIVSGDIVTYGYENRAHALVTVTPPADAKTASLKVKVDWLVCRETCIPATQTLSLRMPVGQVAIPTTSFRAPKVPTERTPAKAVRREKGYAVLFPELREAEGAYFYLSDAGVVNHAAPQAFVPSADGLTVDLQDSPYASEVAKRLRGVLVIDKGSRALLVDTPVTPQE